MKELRPHPRDGFRIMQSADDAETLFEEGLDLADYAERAGWMTSHAAHAIFTIRKLEERLAAQERRLAYLERHAPESVDDLQTIEDTRR